MHEPSQHISGDDHPSDHLSIDEAELSIERLMSRIVDGEATIDEREAFARLADCDPQLWRRLAIRHQHMALLSARVETELNAVERIELPAARRSALQSGGVRWAIAISGWAAMIGLIVVWSATVMSDRDSAKFKPAVPVGASATALTADEHLSEYLKAPFVVSVLPPTLLEVETQPDGSKILHILRRIEEYIVLEPDEDVPVNESGALTKPPSEMRDDAPEPKRPPKGM